MNFLFNLRKLLYAKKDIFFLTCKANYSPQKVNSMDLTKSNKLKNF